MLRQPSMYDDSDGCRGSRHALDDALQDREDERRLEAALVLPGGVEVEAQPRSVLRVGREGRPHEGPGVGDGECAEHLHRRRSREAHEGHREHGAHALRHRVLRVERGQTAELRIERDGTGLPSWQRSRASAAERASSRPPGTSLRRGFSHGPRALMCAPVQHPRAPSSGRGATRANRAPARPPNGAKKTHERPHLHQRRA